MVAFKLLLLLPSFPPSFLSPLLLSSSAWAAKLALLLCPLQHSSDLRCWGRWGRGIFFVFHLRLFSTTAPPYLYLYISSKPLVQLCTCTCICILDMHFCICNSALSPTALAPPAPATATATAPPAPLLRHLCATAAPQYLHHFSTTAHCTSAPSKHFCTSAPLLHHCTSLSLHHPLHAEPPQPQHLQICT